MVDQRVKKQILRRQAPQNDKLVLINKLPRALCWRALIFLPLPAGEGWGEGHPR